MLTQMEGLVIILYLLTIIIAVLTMLFDTWKKRIWFITLCGAAFTPIGIIFGKAIIRTINGG